MGMIVFGGGPEQVILVKCNPAQDAGSINAICDRASHIQAAHLDKRHGIDSAWSGHGRTDDAHGFSHEMNDVLQGLAFINRYARLVVELAGAGSWEMHDEFCLAEDPQGQEQQDGKS